QPPPGAVFARPRPPVRRPNAARDRVPPRGNQPGNRRRDRHRARLGLAQPAPLGRPPDHQDGTPQGDRAGYARTRGADRGHQAGDSGKIAAPHYSRGGTTLRRHAECERAARRSARSSSHPPEPQDHAERDLRKERSARAPLYWRDETVEWNNVEPDSDYAAFRAHEISITPLQVRRTDYASL